MMIVVMITITLAFFSKWRSELMLIRPTSGVGWWMHPRDIYRPIRHAVGHVETMGSNLQQRGGE